MQCENWGRTNGAQRFRRAGNYIPRWIALHREPGADFRQFPSIHGGNQHRAVRCKKLLCCPENIRAGKESCHCIHRTSEYNRQGEGMPVAASPVFGGNVSGSLRRRKRSPACRHASWRTDISFGRNPEPLQSGRRPSCHCRIRSPYQPFRAGAVSPAAQDICFAGTGSGYQCPLHGSLCFSGRKSSFSSTGIYYVCHGTACRILETDS